MERKKKKSGSAVNSNLLRRPIRRWFPLFLLPTIIAFCIGFIYPFIKGVYLSFCKFTTTSDATFIGIENYIKAFSDKSFLYAFIYTSAVAVVSIIVINVLAFAIAYALTRSIKGANIFRTVFFMPNLIGGIVLGYIWSMIFNGILSRFGTSIATNTAWGFWGLIILMAWQQIGYMMIIYIAGLQSVPEDMIEAARIDGANGWQILGKITIPTVMPSITICTFLSLTNSFKLFDQNLVLNKISPILSKDFLFFTKADMIPTTRMLAYNIYQSFYGDGATAKGVGQAKAVIFFIIVAAIALIQLSSTRSKEVQQ